MLPPGIAGDFARQPSQGAAGLCDVPRCALSDKGTGRPRRSLFHFLRSRVIFLGTREWQKMPILLVGAAGFEPHPNLKNERTSAFGYLIEVRPLDAERLGDVAPG
jgi:hypothetical protein